MRKQMRRLRRRYPPWRQVLVRAVFTIGSGEEMRRFGALVDNSAEPSDEATKPPAAAVKLRDEGEAAGAQDADTKREEGRREVGARHVARFWMLAARRVALW